MNLDEAVGNEKECLYFYLKIILVIFYYAQRFQMQLFH